MPSSFGKISQVAVLQHNYSELRASESEPAFDWGFDLELPFEHLSVFARHLDSAAPIAQLPVFAIAGFALAPKSRDALRGAAARVVVPSFPKIPLGVIGTDHVGYGSFDLWPLRQVQVLRAIRDVLAAAGLLGAAGVPRLTLQLAELRVMPFKDPKIAFDALTEGDLAPDFICLRMDLDAGMLAGRSRWPSMPSMQTPGILDWRLSPGSFSMSGALLIGADGCETLLPSNLATRLIRFRQLVRTVQAATAEAPADAPAQVPPPGPAAFPGSFGVRFFAPTGLLAGLIPTFTGDLLLGYAVQYNTEWFPLGHSLGQIAYSLPLAPGEKMRIAIIDWTRRETAKRTEQTTEKEDLQHAALRERSLSEAVSMVVRESQSGSSVSAGGPLSALAGIPIGPASLGLGSLFGGGGGGSANSQGMRSVVGNTTQQISDAFHQATSSQRELNSTVVVQSVESETAEAKTRVIANYNHSHALTILYYEVLQHQRVLTRPAGVKPVLFLKHSVADFTYGQIELHRAALVAMLLDESLRGCFDVVTKRNCLELNLARAKKRLSALGDPLDNVLVGDITIEYTTGAQVPIEDIKVSLIPTLGGAPIACNLVDPALTVNSFGTGKPDLLVSTPLSIPAQPPRLSPNSQFVYVVRPAALIHWKNVSAIEVGQQLNATSISGPLPDWTVRHVRATTANGATVWLMVDAANPGNIPVSTNIRVPVKGFVPPIDDVEDLLSDDERCCLRRLLTHLNAHAAHYWRAVWLTEPAPDRARRLERWKLGTQPLSSLVENTLLDFVDEYAVMPVVAGAEAALARPFGDDSLGKAKPPVFTESIEQLVTVPARGVFAEAKLGHCNASEVIDNTRFWDWQISPIPDDAPAIAPTSTNTRAGDATGALTAAPPPPSIVNIVNAPPVPVAGAVAVAGAAPAAAAAPAVPVAAGAQPAAPIAAAPKLGAFDPRPIPPPAPLRSSALSPKSRLIVFTFAFDTNDLMFGRWTVELISGGDIRRESRMINSLQQRSGVDLGNRVEMYLEESFGGTADVSLHINGTIVGLPWTLGAGTRSYDGRGWAEPRDIRADLTRAEFAKARTIQIVQAADAVTFTITRVVEDGGVETGIVDQTAGLEVGVENFLASDAIPPILEGKDAIAVSAKGTYGVRVASESTTQTATGFSEDVVFTGFKITDKAPTVTALS